MRFAVSLALAAVLAAAVSGAISRAAPGRSLVAPQTRPWTADPSNRLQAILDAAVRATRGEFAAAGLRDEELAATLIDLGNPARAESAHVGGDTRFYPASVVKLFYLAAAEQWLEDRRLDPDPEILRALRDMIVDSSNDATAYVLDALTSTSSGPPLNPAEMKAWSANRNAVNRYFSGLGYRDINVNQKTWCEGPYGRDRLFIGATGDNRNALTTNATARLLAEIVTDRAVTASRSAEMRGWLARDWLVPSTDADDQATGFSGRALPKGARLWSKAGWTSTVRHDAAYIELPDGARFVLVTFTANHSAQRDIIPALARRVVAATR